MTSEMYIENRHVDLSAEFSSLITFELDNIRDFSSRSTTWSKTIILPGTANNNKLFGHIFQIGQGNFYDANLDNVNYNFNASKSADCLIFQDQIQTFKGVLRLLQINLDRGRIEYEVAVFGEISGLVVQLSSKKLEDLDFSAYDHEYNTTNIINSWDNTPGSGYFYPLIDYGQTSVDKHNWDIRTFRPALYVKEYIDKMFTMAGFRFSSALFDTDRFKRLVVPNSNKELLSETRDLIEAAATTQDGVSAPYKVIFSSSQGSGFTISGGTDFTYAGATNTVGIISFNFNTILVGFLPNTQTLNINRNGVSIFSQTKSERTNFWTGTFNANLSVGDVITFEFFFSPVDAFLRVSSGSINIDSVNAVIVNTEPGDDVVLNNTIAKNVRQIDFFVSIIKLFNLYVYEDKHDSRLIYITPYVDFYSTSPLDAVDWSYKLNRDKVQKVKPMSELNAKIYDFKYKSDSDFYNDLYRKRYGEGYGDHTFDSQYEFSEEKQSLELIFSATPLVGYAGEDKVISTIFKRSNEIEERVPSNMRILQSKKITGVTSWDILNGPSTVMTSTTDYGYAGHFDDPDAPSNDLNFGVLKELFFTLVSGDLSKTQFNVYWSAYLAEITDKDSKLLIARFYLTQKDIIDLDFSKKIYIDGVLFRLVSIKDYNMSEPSDCECELLKVNYLQYVDSLTPGSCVAVGLGQSVSMPDANVNTQYNYIITLTGTPPFTLSSITKPSWMSISVYGNQVILSGVPAPGDLDTGVEVSFTVNNCTSDTQAISDTIDVLEGNGNAVNVGLGNSESEACGSSSTVYVAPPNMTIAPGVIIYNAADLMVAVTGSDYIRDSGGTLYYLDALTGEVGAPTGNTC